MASRRSRGQPLVARRSITQMTEQEFKDLMAHFYFLGDKIDPVYKRETDKVIENIEKEYKQYVKKWF